MVKELTKDKKKTDMLTGPLWNRIFLFALPLALTGILQQLFNAADIAVVGRFTGELGKVSMAAVGANSSVISLVVNLFVGLSLGANVLIAKAVGMRDKSAIERVVHTSIAFALLGGVVACALGELFAVPILTLMRVEGEVLAPATLYLRIYLAGLPVILLYNYEAAILRAVGDTKTPLTALTISGCLNIALNLFFVAGFKMTVDGVALATVISNLVSSLILLRKLVFSRSDVRVDLRRLRIDRRAFVKMIQIGFPAGLQSAVFSFANIIIQSAINSLGTVVMAASSAAYNVEIFAYYVMTAFSQACTTFVGQNSGAGKIDRCRKTLVLCLAEDAAALLTVIGLMLLFGREILSIFNTDPEVIETGYIRLVLILASYAFSLVHETTASYMRGFGISMIPAVLTMISICGVRIFWIYVVFEMSPTFATIMTVYPVSLLAAAVLLTAATALVRPARRQEKRIAERKEESVL